MPLADYHIFQLSCSVKDAESSLSFSEVENDLSGGFYSQLLLGSENGERAWNLTLPSLQGGTLNAVQGIDNQDLSQEAYLWDLYAHTKVTGEPFAFKDPRNGQYYLVRFSNPKLSYSRMLSKLYSTGIELKQVRQKGKYVFDPLYTDANSLWFDQTGHVGTTWRNRLLAGGYSHQLAASGDVVFSANPQNLLNTVRFSGTASTGRVISQNSVGADIDLLLSDVFIVMKMREATFSNASGIFSSPSSFSYLTGLIGDTKFGSGYSFEYRKNSVIFPNTNYQAPMNTFAVIHLRFGIADQHNTAVTLGQNLALAGTFAKMDVAEIGFSSKVLSMTEAREIVEYLAIKWAI